MPIDLTPLRVLSASGIIAHLSLASSFLGTIALALVLEYKYLRTKDQDYLHKARMFSVISTIIFGVGAAYGTFVEFGLVTVWSNFIAMIGAVALPFYLELFAFLFEVVVLPIYTVTWDKIKNGRLHFLIGIIAAFGGYWSAYNILAVMASLSMLPPGLKIVNLAQQGQSISRAITYMLVWSSPTQMLNMYWSGAQIFIFHGILAAVIVSWSLVAGVYIYKYVRDKDPVRKKVLNLMLIPLAAITGIQGLVLGHFQGELVISEDPLKLAAMEGMYWNGLKVDPLTSFVAYGTLNHQFWGYYSWPASIRPPTYVTFAYLIMMVGFGIVLGILALALGLDYAFGENLKKIGFGWLYKLQPLLEKVSQYLIPFSGIMAGIGGALTTESGRFPLIFVSSVPSTSGPPEITGVPVSALVNVALNMPVWEIALLVIVALAIPFVAVYGIWIYVNRR
ncbi:MAG: cytochrome ubiquinol oxidase subunit I [Nitrososphaeria archaeon]